MKLGFHPPLTRLYVFVKNEANHLWYWLEDGQKRYIQHTAITGILKRFEIKESQTSFGNEEKADFEIIADRRYVLRSGIDTAFTKGMLMLIAALSDERINRPITLELKAGDKTNVLVSGRDPQTFEPIITGSWEGANWESLLESAIARLGGSQPDLTISEKQYEDLLVKVKSTGYTMARFAELLSKYGYTKGSEIAQSSYPLIWAEVGDRRLAEKMN